MPFRVDERVLKPRVAGFIAVGGSLTPQWKTLDAPVLHTMTFSMQIAVVDQVVSSTGAGTPRSIVLDAGGARPRRGSSARNVAAQLGRRSTTPSTCGDAGAVPDVPSRRDRAARHATSSARRAARAASSTATVGRPTGRTSTPSVIWMAEKRAHYREIRETAQRHAALRDEIEERASAYDGYDRVRERHVGPAGLVAQARARRQRRRHARRRARPGGSGSTACSCENAIDSVAVPLRLASG